MILLFNTGTKSVDNDVSLEIVHHAGSMCCSHKCWGISEFYSVSTLHHIASSQGAVVQVFVFFPYIRKFSCYIQFQVNLTFHDFTAHN